MNLVLRDALEFRRDPLGCLARLAATRGDVALLRLGRERVWLLARAELAAEVLAGRPHDFVKSSLLARRGRLLFGRALTALDGDAWATRRRALAPAFDAAFYRGAVATCTRVAEAAVAELPLDGTHDLRALAGEWCLRLALAAILGDEDPQSARRLAPVAVAAIEGFGARARALVAGPDAWPLGSAARIRRAMTEVRAHVARHLDGGLAARLGGIARADLVDDLAVDVAVGAHQAALALTWSLVEAGRVDASLDVDAVLAEALRLHPPFYLLLRQTCRVERFDGVTLPAGSHLAVSPWLLHRDPRSFREPLRFDPSRFAAARPPAGAYLPFGLGPRGCPGRQLVVVMIAAVWRALVARGTFAIDATQVRERASAALDVDGRVTLRCTSRRGIDTCGPRVAHRMSGA